MNISVELINAILGYLGNKPYIEVAHLIVAIQTEVAKPAEPEQVSE